MNYSSVSLSGFPILLLLFSLCCSETKMHQVDGDSELESNSEIAEEHADSEDEMEPENEDVYTKGPQCRDWQTPPYPTNTEESCCDRTTCCRTPTQIPWDENYDFLNYRFSLNQPDFYVSESFQINKNGDFLLKFLGCLDYLDSYYDGCSDYLNSRQRNVDLQIRGNLGETQIDAMMNTLPSVLRPFQGCNPKEPIVEDSPVWTLSIQIGSEILFIPEYLPINPEELQLVYSAIKKELTKAKACLPRDYVPGKGQKTLFEMVFEDTEGNAIFFSIQEDRTYTYIFTPKNGSLPTELSGTLSETTVSEFLESVKFYGKNCFYGSEGCMANEKGSLTKRRIVENETIFDFVVFDCIAENHSDKKNLPRQY